jgi:Fe-S-cluster containining protein
MNVSQLFQSYEFLTDKADAAFHRMEKEYDTCIKCERYCSDCCHAVFGLFLIEAACLKQHFDQLDHQAIKESLQRCNDTDRALKRLEIKLQANEEDAQMQNYILARERVRCPLLDDKRECILYPYRPITCRVYGIPTKIHGKARVCGKSGFKKNESYPAFNLDEVYRDLFNLSKELLNSEEKGNPEKASLLISVSKAISTPMEEIITGIFE